MTTARPRTIPHDRMIRILIRIGACPEAMDWLSGQSRTGAQTWHACQCGDWLLWVAEEAKVDGEILTRAYHAYDNVPRDDKAEAIAVRKHIPWRVVAAAMASNNGRFE